MHKLNEQERIAKGKRREEKMLQILNDESPIEFGEHTLTMWKPASEAEDIQRKIDAWVATNDDELLAVQLKSRDRQPDLGIAAIRPYRGYSDYCERFDEGRLQMDRDMKNMPSLYVCFFGPRKFMVASGDFVKRTVQQMLREFRKTGFTSNGRTSMKSGNKMVELKLVTDRGKGYSGGQQKIICYIKPEFLVKYGGAVMRERK